MTNSRILRRVLARLRVRRDRRTKGKKSGEINFWRSELDRYVDWYQGRNWLRNVSPPRDDQKATSFSLRVNAAMTWLELFQKRKYLADLRLRPESFAGMRLLDIGCGPFPSTLAFDDCERHGLDPLIEEYQNAGFPIGEWSGSGYTFHHAAAERMPFKADSFDAIVSVNAIDHVDDFAATAAEIRRILKPDGLFCMHVHYHTATILEPMELNDERFLQNYGWVPNLRKAVETVTKDCGLYTAPPGELFVVWSNMSGHNG